MCYHLLKSLFSLQIADWAKVWPMAPWWATKGSPGGPGAPSYNEYVKRLPLFVFQSEITQKSVYLHDDMKCNNNCKKTQNKVSNIMKFSINLLYLTVFSWGLLRHQLPFFAILTAQILTKISQLWWSVITWSECLKKYTGFSLNNVQVIFDSVSSEVLSQINICTLLLNEHIDTDFTVHCVHHIS